MRAVARQAAFAPEIGSFDEARHVIARQSRTIERLQFLVEASKALNSTVELGELLGLILDLATTDTRAERGTVFLVDTKREELWSLIARGVSHHEIRLPMGSGIAGHVARTGDVINLVNAYNDPRFNPDIDRALGYHTQTLLCVPIKDREGRINGVLQLLNKQGGPFVAEDVEFLEGISVHAAIALENAQLHHERARHRFMERELNVACHIQESLLPQRAPEVPGLDIATRHESSFVVGGDYYDFIALGTDTLIFVVGDVEGKGVASALVMSNVQATLNALVMHVHSLEGILFTLNESILRNTLGTKFMTLFVGLIDLPRRGLHYINAGHCPPVVISGAGGAVPLTEGGMSIGMFPKVRYKRGVHQLSPGDVILAYTDGITEARSLHGQHYESERMVATATSLRSCSAQEIVDGVFEDCGSFAQGSPHGDDKVVMAIRVET
jgi:serine phosphatase RsbU (regulator of sigma subunit)